MDLSIFLKDRRIKAGLSQADVAKKLGYTSSQFISNWERGLSKPPVATLRKLADLYGVSLNEIFDVVLQNTIEEVKADFKEKFFKQGNGK